MESLLERRGRSSFPISFDFCIISPPSLANPGSTFLSAHIACRHLFCSLSPNCFNSTFATLDNLHFAFLPTSLAITNSPSLANAGSAVYPSSPSRPRTCPPLHHHLHPHCPLSRLWVQSRLGVGVVVRFIITSVAVLLIQITASIPHAARPSTCRDLSTPG